MTSFKGAVIARYEPQRNTDWLVTFTTITKAAGH